MIDDKSRKYVNDMAGIGAKEQEHNDPLEEWYENMYTKCPTGVDEEGDEGYEQ